MVFSGEYNDDYDDHNDRTRIGRIQRIFTDSLGDGCEGSSLSFFKSVLIRVIRCIRVLSSFVSWGPLNVRATPT